MTKIISDGDIQKLPKKGNVLVGGCFDILHDAHIEFLPLAKAEGQTLTLLLESDEKIKTAKGNGRPLNNQTTRAENLSKLNIVDYIILLKNPKSSQYYYNLVKLIQPDIIAITKGDPFTLEKKEQAEMVGGKVAEVMDRDNRHSSTKLFKKL